MKHGLAAPPWIRGTRGGLDGDGSRTGLAMVAVLLVLMALFVLSAPFLLTVRNADKASTRIADQAAARIALDAATHHVRHRLGVSHGGEDQTPYFDSLEELSVSNRFPSEFLNANDPKGVMWDMEVEDLAGRIDVNSAPPQVIANLTGGVGHLRTELSEKATTLSMHASTGFDPEGLVWVKGELMSYATNEGGLLSGLTRGLQVLIDEDGEPYRCGPQPAKDLEIGRLVLDERAMAVARWRVGSGDGVFRRFSALEEVSAASLGMLSALNIEAKSAWSAYAKLLRTTTTFGDVGAGATWQRGARLVGKVSAGPESGCRLVLDDVRWFNPGTTVRIRDGETTEIGIVREASARGILLMQPLANDYFPYAAVVEPLARRPVNINTAKRAVLRALVLNLRLRGNSSRISSRKADQLVEVILESRPLVSFEDFVQRVVLPSAGLEELPKDAPVVPEALAQSGASGTAGFLTSEDAVALHKNALNANDTELGFSTMPFSFITRNVYGLAVRSAVNAKSGVERVSANRESVELVVPQRPLMRVWGRQEDFDEALRLERAAKGWVSGPSVTSRFDPSYGSDPPTRSRSHLGPHDTLATSDPFGADPELTFASQEEEGWTQLAAARVDERDSSVAPRSGKVLHFDNEHDDFEGRYLPNGTLPLPVDGRTVDWLDDGGLLRPISFSMWVKPRSLEDGARLLDLGSRFPDSDRISLLFDAGDLVLRVIDGAGDHPETTMEEFGEARYPLDGAGPGMPLDTWIHISGDVRGNRPDQITLLVDGRYSAESRGLTKLTAGIIDSTDQITVESTDGFPDEPCVLRIGNELIEAVKTSETSFSSIFETTGANAGFGGRQARELFLEGPDPPISAALLNSTIDLDHPVGTIVTLYGYSTRLSSNIPPVEARLASPLSVFAVARVTGIVKGRDRLGVQMEAIELNAGTSTIEIGFGMDSQADDVEGLILEPADVGVNISRAFQQNGGYALLLGVTPTITTVAGGATTEDTNGIRLGGMEILHYTEWDGTHLMFDRRGDAVPELQRLQGMPGSVRSLLEGRAAWVFQWENVILGTNQDPQDLMGWNVKIIPISLEVRGGGGNFGFPAPARGESAFVQLSPFAATEAHLTEWVRYDEIVGNQLVRSDWRALNRAFLAGQAGDPAGDGDFNPPNPPGSVGGLGQNNIAPPLPPTTIPPRRIKPPRITASQAGGSYWQPHMGSSEDDDAFVARAVGSALQFRGVLGTYSHEHFPGATRVLPVWFVTDTDVSGGRPGRFDRIALMESDAGTVGWPVTVHRSHRPFEYREHAFAEDPGVPLGVALGQSSLRSQDAFLTGRTYLALTQASPAAIAAGSSGTAAALFEPRRWGRMTKFPSGERPREVASMRVGGAYGDGGEVPSAIVDEVVFGTTAFGQLDGIEATHGAQLFLELLLRPGVRTLNLVDHSVRTSRNWSSSTSRFLRGLAGDAGLVRIGEEICCYDSYDEATFSLNLAPGGRGLLGSEEEYHAQGEAVTFLNSIRVSTLASAISGSDFAIPMTDSEGFPSKGLVLIDDELIHYSWIDGSSLGMPVGSVEAGRMDRRGAGLFRGRFGTDPAGHAVGTPVIVMPYRYADLWAERANAPELSFCGISLQQPGALWQGSFFDFEAPVASGPRLGVLQRSDPSVPWDADPDRNKGIEIYWKGTNNGEPNQIGDQSDRIDWRVFVRYDSGSFDPVGGMAHGWKTTPRLRFLGVEYLGPGRVFSRIER